MIRKSSSEVSRDAVERGDSARATLIYFSVSGVAEDR